ncbi:Dynein Regulatory Complex Subunit 6 [Manis pentadactyla]|nr:Dynein Regulatory Complex Subunit 6 [Manis pentadactyla]
MVLRNIVSFMWNNAHGFFLFMLVINYKGINETDQVGDDIQMGVLYLFVKLKEYSNGIREDEREKMEDKAK